MKLFSKDYDSIDLKFERAPKYDDESYDNDNDYDLPGPIMRPVHSTLPIKKSPLTKYWL